MYLHLFNPLASLQGFQLDCRLAEFRPEAFQLAACLLVVFQPEVFQLVESPRVVCLLAECLLVVYQRQVGLTRRLQQSDGHDGQLPSAYRLLKPLGLL